LLLVDPFVSERSNEPRTRSLGRFDLDDLRPKPGKQQTAIFGCLVGVFDYGQARKDPRSVGWSKSSADVWRSVARAVSSVMMTYVVVQAGFAALIEKASKE
jgi:uncharacterized protein (UPF0264 family)